MKWRDKLNNSPINYFSDLFIIAMVVLWIVDNVYESVVASAVTISSIILSHQAGCANYDTSMWSSIGSNIALPLSCGGALWMIKNAIQHALANNKGKQAHEDFPAPHPDGEIDDIEIEEFKAQEPIESENVDETLNEDEEDERGGMTL